MQNTIIFVTIGILLYAYGCKILTVETQYNIVMYVPIYPVIARISFEASQNILFHIFNYLFSVASTWFIPIFRLT